MNSRIEKQCEKAMPSVERALATLVIASMVCLLICISATNATAQAQGNSIVVNLGKAKGKVTFANGKAGTITVAFPDGGFNDLTGPADSVKTDNKMETKNKGKYLLRYLGDLTITLKHDKDYKGNDWKVVQSRGDRNGDANPPTQDISFCFFEKKVEECVRNQKSFPAGLLVYANFQLLSFQQDPKTGEGIFNFKEGENMTAPFGTLISGSFNESSKGVLTLKVDLGKGNDLNKLKKDLECDLISGSAKIKPANKKSSPTGTKLEIGSEALRSAVLVGNPVPITVRVMTAQGPLAGVSVVFTNTLGDLSFVTGEIALDSKQSTVMTDEDGNATVTFVGGQPGLSIVEMNSQGLSEKIAVSATNIAPTTP